MTASTDPRTAQRRKALEAVASTGGAEAREAKRMLAEMDAPATASTARDGGAVSVVSGRESMRAELRKMGLEPVR